MSTPIPTILSPDKLRRDYAVLRERETAALSIRIAQEHTAALEECLDTIFDHVARGQLCRLRRFDGHDILIGRVEPSEPEESQP